MDYDYLEPNYLLRRILAFTIGTIIGLAIISYGIYHCVKVDLLMGLIIIGLGFTTFTFLVCVILGANPVSFIFLLMLDIFLRKMPIFLYSLSLGSIIFAIILKILSTIFIIIVNLIIIVFTYVLTSIISVFIFPIAIYRNIKEID